MEREKERGGRVREGVKKDKEERERERNIEREKHGKMGEIGGESKKERGETKGVKGGK